MVLDFCLYFLLTQRCWWGCKLHKRQIWREDIVTPYVVTYAVPLRRRFQFYTKTICKIDRKLPHKQKKNRSFRFLYKQHNLRGYFDEKRLDEVFLE